MPNPTLIQQTSEVLSTTPTTTTTLPSIPTTGNYLFVTALTVTTSAAVIKVSDNKATSYALAVRSTAVGGGNDFKSEIWYGKVISTSTTLWQITVTGTGTATRYSFKVEEYSNLLASTASVLSTTSKGSISNSSSLTVSIAVVPSTAGLIFAGFTDNMVTTNDGVVAPGGIWTNLWTEQVGSSWVAGSFEYTVPVSSGTYSATWTISSSASSLTGCMAFFQGATAAGGAVLRPRRFALLGVV